MDRGIARTLIADSVKALVFEAMRLLQISPILPPEADDFRDREDLEDKLVSTSGMCNGFEE
ncbi:hypothetical protein J3R74_003380 [Puniceicoccus vermicola]|uniref:Uncharacterized protein n=1 Tax=Puniceicoccus vermicola TaxID=388746 RepID=A0A7X1E3X9_9BACT|nr:hypothetical protein [Puniceicoccus vermicola]MBC2601444.1 hypothetical protein [Puniceicoccus vermicola]